MKTTQQKRQQLQNYLEIADDKKVRAIYTMMEDEIKEASITYNLELKDELDNRYAAYKNGTEKLISASESKKRITRMMKKIQK